MGEFLRRWVSAGRGVWLAAGVCLLLAAAAFPFDHAVTDRVRELSGWQSGDLVHLVTDFGTALSLCAAFVVLLVLYGEERTGVQGLLGVLWAGLVTDVVKAIVSRPRPDMGPYSFPSGHATCVFAAAVVLARRWPRWRYVFYLGAAGVAASRVLRLRHFPSDVFAGAAIGLSFGLAATVITEQMSLLVNPRAMLHLKVVLSVLLVAAVFVVREWPQPFAALAAPALLLLAVRRTSILLRPGLSHDG